ISDNFDSKLNYITQKLTYQQDMLENYTLRLQKAITNNMAMKKTQLASVKVTKPQPIINNMQKKFQEKIANLDLVIQNYLTYQQSKLTNITRILNNLSYRKVLKRGYAVVKNDNDKVITNLTEFNKLKNYNIEFHDGVTNKLSND
ncbi:MAG: exodeoxyribonuclease VII large subunit, partial [Pseudomonadota bacterium]